MKKIIIALILMGAVFSNTFAQGYDVVEAGERDEFNHSEVYLTAGLPSFLGLFSGMFVAIAEAVAQSNENGSSDSQKKDAAFTVTGGYNYFFNEYFGVGGFVSYEKFSSLSILTAQAKLTAQYGWEHFKFFHSVSGGISIVPGAGKPSYAFDATYLGLKLDFKDFNLFAEGCIPMGGIIRVGASYKF